MLAVGEKAQRAREEFVESLAMMLEIEKEGLSFTQSEVERRHCLFMRTLRRKKA